MTWAVTAMVAAAALTAYNEKETARKQDRAVSQGILQHMQATRDQSTAMQKAFAQLKGSNAQPAVEQAKAGYMKALSANPTMGTQPAQVGALSDAYRQAAGTAANDSAGQAAKTAGLMAITDAPAIQRQDETGQIGKLQAALGTMGIAANDASNQAMLRARGIRPNAWINLAATALSAYGRGAAAGGGATTAGAADVQSPSSAGYFQGGNFAGGGNYTGPGSTSTDYAGNLNTLYGIK